MKIWGLVLMATVIGCASQADASVVDMFFTMGDLVGQSAGQVSFTKTEKGLKVDVDLQNIPAGEHGFHIHEFPSCQAGVDANGNAVAAQKAGGHYDPEKTGKHLGPHGNGHKGDLPVLNASSDGKIRKTFYLQNLSLEEVRNKSLILHVKGDNYNDEPKPLGGGEGRLACGIIK